MVWLIVNVVGYFLFSEVFLIDVCISVGNVVGWVGDGWLIVMMLFGFECGLYIVIVVIDFEWDL